MSDPRRVLASLRGLLHTAFLGLLILGVIRMLVAGRPSGSTLGSWHPVAGLVLAGLTAAVYVVGTLRWRPSIGRRPSHRLALWWLGTVTLLWCALCAVGPDYIWVAFPLFLWHLRLLRRRHAIFAVALLTAVTIASQAIHGGRLGYAMVLGPLIGATFAIIIAIAYDELSSAQHQLGQQAERARLAREIHDTLAQGLSGIVLLSRSARTRLDGIAGAEEVRELVSQTEQLADDNLAEARRFVRDLTPPDLATGSLPSALRRLAEQSSSAELAVRVQLDGTPCPLPSPVEVALLRAAQGSVANALQHAAPSMVVISLSYADDEVRLDVFDDGRGFDPAALPPPGIRGSRGFGLAGLRDRITAAGGRLEVESAPGEGTVIAVRLPLTHPAKTRTTAEEQPSATDARTAP